MKKYCIIDNSLSKRGIETIVAFDSIDEAIKTATEQWEHMHEKDKEDRDEYCVALCNVKKVNGIWQYVEDENGNINADYDIIKEFC